MGNAFPSLTVFAEILTSVSFCHACLIDFIQELTDFAHQLILFPVSGHKMCGCLDAFVLVLTDPEYQHPSLRLSPVVFA